MQKKKKHTRRNAEQAKTNAETFSLQIPLCLKPGVNCPIPTDEIPASVCDKNQIRSDQFLCQRVLQWIWANAHKVLFERPPKRLVARLESLRPNCQQMCGNDWEPVCEMSVLHKKQKNKKHEKQ